MSMKTLVALVVLLCLGLGATLRWYVEESEVWRGEVVRCARETVEGQIVDLEGAPDVVRPAGPAAATAARSEAGESGLPADELTEFADFIDRLRARASRSGERDDEPGSAPACPEVARNEPSPTPRRASARAARARPRAGGAARGVGTRVRIATRAGSLRVESESEGVWSPRSFPSCVAGPDSERSSARSESPGTRPSSRSGSCASWSSCSAGSCPRSSYRGSSCRGGSCPESSCTGVGPTRPEGTTGGPTLSEPGSGGS